MPECKKDVQQFLGFTNFYRQFIKAFSDAIWLLFDLTRKRAPWVWTELEVTAFQAIKDAVTWELVLVLPDESKPYWLEVDSSDYATDAVLSQQGDNGKWHPVAFYSKSLSLVQRNYEIHDKEMLAII
jgi:hypothetical protein